MLLSRYRVVLSRYFRPHLLYSFIWGEIEGLLGTLQGDSVEIVCVFTRLARVVQAAEVGIRHVYTLIVCVRNEALIKYGILDCTAMILINFPLEVLRRDCVLQDGEVSAGSIGLLLRGTAFEIEVDTVEV